MSNNLRSCPSHCCQIHGCKYGYDDCPVATGKVAGGSCEQCGLESEGYYGDAAQEAQAMYAELNLSNSPPPNHRNNMYEQLKDYLCYHKDNLRTKLIVQISNSTGIQKFTNPDITASTEGIFIKHQEQSIKISTPGTFTGHSDIGPIHSHIQTTTLYPWHRIHSIDIITDLSQEAQAMYAELNCPSCGHRYAAGEVPEPSAEAMLHDAWELLTAVRDPRFQDDVQDWLRRYDEYNPVNLADSTNPWSPVMNEPKAPPKPKSTFLKEFEMPDETREELEQLWGRLTVPQSKELLWEKQLKNFAGLGGSLAAALKKRDIVGCWIVTHQPYPSPPVAIIQMGLAMGFISENRSRILQSKLPVKLREPFKIPDNQAIPL